MNIFTPTFPVEKRPPGVSRFSLSLIHIKSLKIANRPLRAANVPMIPKSKCFKTSLKRRLTSAVLPSAPIVPLRPVINRYGVNAKRHPELDADLFTLAGAVSADTSSALLELEGDLLSKKAKEGRVIISAFGISRFAETGVSADATSFSGVTVRFSE